MKKIILVLCLLVNSLLYCQNIVDPPNLFTLTNDSLQQDISLLNGANQTKFLLGWNWGSPGAEIDKALKINTHHEYNLYSNDYPVNMNAIQSCHTILCSRQTNLPFTAIALFLNPTITVDSSIHFKPRPYNSDGAVFGFCNKNKVRILDSLHHTDSEYPFAILDKDSVPYGTSTLVLSNIWKKDTNINRPNNFLGADNSASKKFFVQLIKFA